MTLGLAFDLTLDLDPQVKGQAEVRTVVLRGLAHVIKRSNTLSGW